MTPTKKEFIDILLEAWELDKHLRLGQFICFIADSTDLFYVNDEELFSRLKRFIDIDKESK